MNQEECKEIKQALDLFLNESLERILMSNPTDSGKISRSRIRPLLRQKLHPAWEKPLSW